MNPEKRPEIRLVRIGGRTSKELLDDLNVAGIKMNEYALKLLSSERFVTSDEPRILKVVVVTVRDLGFPHGANTDAIYKEAAQHNLGLGPIELAPHFRLQFLEQAEGSVGYPPTHQKAPPGSITVASAPLDQDVTFPKGFYLRRIEGTRWLRGYCCDGENLWAPDDHFAFCKER